jgi:hypothetical protein
MVGMMRSLPLHVPNQSACRGVHGRKSRCRLPVVRNSSAPASNTQLVAPIKKDLVCCGHAQPSLLNLT